MYKKILLVTAISTILGTSGVGAASFSVETDGLRKREAPHLASTIHGLHYEGDVVDVISTEGDWAHVQGQTGRYFVHLSHLRSLETAKPQPQGETAVGGGRASDPVKRVPQQVPAVSKPQTRAFTSPTEGRVSQGYGAASGAHGYTFHNGIDIANRPGTPVKATADGEVTKAGWNDAYGNYVMMAHGVDGERYLSLYAHLSDLKVQAGQQVAQGETIGGMGSTGNSTGSHLHFELHRDAYVYSPTGPATSVDPSRLMRF